MGLHIKGIAAKLDERESMVEVMYAYQIFRSSLSHVSGHEDDNLSLLTHFYRSTWRNLKEQNPKTAME
jgi:hypothetical protein